MRPWRMLDGGPLVRVAATTLAVLALAACNSSSAPVVPFSVAAVSGSDQFANVGAPTANPLVVLVLGDNSAPFAGAKVRWAVTSGGGTVSDSTTTSDSSGHAQVTYTAGSQPGTAKITATLENLFTATFTVHVEATSAAAAARHPSATPTWLAASPFTALHR